MKVRPSVKKMCEKCKVIRRHGRVHQAKCPGLLREKQRAMEQHVRGPGVAEHVQVCQQCRELFEKGAALGRPP